MKRSSSDRCGASWMTTPADTQRMRNALRFLTITAAACSWSVASDTVTSIVGFAVARQE
jgi:hypothetical protein